MKKIWSVTTIIYTLEFLIGSALLGFLLYWHFKTGMTRFFDVDEFTHLHWAANIARGQKPYIDFFTFFTPGFYWILTPLFWVFGKSTALFIASRIFAFVIFTGIVALTGIIYRTVRSKRFFLIPMILLAFLPMPFDKFIEVRPDNISVVFGLLGIMFQIYATERIHPNKTGTYWFLSGVSYAVSMLILVKSIPFVFVGMCAYLLDINLYGYVVSCMAKKRILPFSLSLEHRNFLYGLGSIGLLFGIWLFSLGDISRAWYSLMKLPFEANTIGRIYIMEPHLFFFPNASFYGGWGITTALLVNHGIWTVGIFSGVLSFFTPYLLSDGKPKRAISEFLISGVFILSVVLYVLFFPMKHSQYLIPIAVFIALYASDVCVWVLRKSGVASPIVLGVLALFLARQTTIVNASKLLLSNHVQMQQIDALKALVHEKEQVLDLDGRFIYATDPYDICCLPFGTFVRFLSRPPRPLAEVLDEKRVRYIYQGTSGRFWELSADMSYIQSHYQQVPGWGDALWERKEL